MIKIRNLTLTGVFAFGIFANSGSSIEFTFYSDTGDLLSTVDDQGGSIGTFAEERVRPGLPGLLRHEDRLTVEDPEWIESRSFIAYASDRAVTSSSAVAELFFDSYEGGAVLGLCNIDLKMAQGYLREENRSSVGGDGFIEFMVDRDVSFSVVGHLSTTMLDRDEVEAEILAEVTPSDWAIGGTFGEFIDYLFPEYLLYNEYHGDSSRRSRVRYTGSTEITQRIAYGPHSGGGLTYGVLKAGTKYRLRLAAIVRSNDPLKVSAEGEIWIQFGEPRGSFPPIVTKTSNEDGNSIIKNGGFESNDSSWEFDSGVDERDPSSAGNAISMLACPGIESKGAMVLWKPPYTEGAKLWQRDISLEPNTEYELRFAAYSYKGRGMWISLYQDGKPDVSYGIERQLFSLKDRWKTYRIAFKTGGSGQVIDDAVLCFGIDDPPALRYLELTYLDNIQIVPKGTPLPESDEEEEEPDSSEIPQLALGPNLIRNGDFSVGRENWITSVAGILDPIGGYFELFSGFGTDWLGLLVNAWDPDLLYYVSQSGISLKPNTDYRLVFMADATDWSPNPSIGDLSDMRVSVFKESAPGVNYGLDEHQVSLTGANMAIVQGMRVFTVEFTSSGFTEEVDDACLQFSFASGVPDHVLYLLDEVGLFEVTPVDSEPEPQEDLMPIGPNLVSNGGFEYGMSFWGYYQFPGHNGSSYPAGVYTGVDPHGRLTFKMDSSTARENMQLYQYGISLEPYCKYRLSFAARSRAGQDVRVNLTKHFSPYTNYGLRNVKVDLVDEEEDGLRLYTVDFETRGFSSRVVDARLWFSFSSEIVGDAFYEIDSVSLHKLGEKGETEPEPSDDEKNNIVEDGDFDIILGKWSFVVDGGGSARIRSPGYLGSSGYAHLYFDQYKMTNAQLFQYGLSLDPDTEYVLRFAAKSNTGNDMRVSLSKHTTPYTNYGLNRRHIDLSTGWKEFEIPFTTKGFGSSVSDARLYFWFADDVEPWDQYCIDNVCLLRADEIQEPDPEPEVKINFLGNGDFEENLSAWKFYTSGDGRSLWGDGGYDGSLGYARLEIDEKASNIQLWQEGVVLEPDTEYVLRFAAKSNSRRAVRVSLSKHTSPYTLYGLNRVRVDLSDEWTLHKVRFRTSGFNRAVSDGRLYFWLADDALAGDVYCIDDVCLAIVESQPSTGPKPDGENVLKNGEYEPDLANWYFYTSGSGRAEYSSSGYDGSSGYARVTVDSDADNVQLWQQGVPLDPYAEYELSFAAKCSSERNLKVSLSKHGSPYTGYGLNRELVELSTEWQMHKIRFTTTGFASFLNDARLFFWFADSARAGDVYSIDQVWLVKVPSD
ncbi:carbohydrate binding domain-containing protein [Pelagicoccus mobilis]|uniref:Carbohydrate binding domain-containing protein n=1 Tax=Pelagicoccus mobilis TaxID=415221 RepID=A0A934RUM9_9BACT|nr:carbohydrate binding domain-containing protein [Pelagicoccus mobilis]MBK1877960.1 carbohydrate binding domain-containing protein [Pelagicoccus mobilis]